MFHLIGLQGVFHLIGLMRESSRMEFLRPTGFLDFRDPWGNRIEIVPYDNIQFTKAANVLRGMGLTHLSKNANAVKELTDKGMAPD